MCKNDDNVSPYLRRRLRSYRQAMCDRDAKTVRPGDSERIAVPDAKSIQTDTDQSSICCNRDCFRDGEV